LKWPFKPFNFNRMQFTSSPSHSAPLAVSLWPHCHVSCVRILIWFIPDNVQSDGHRKSTVIGWWNERFWFGIRSPKERHCRNGALPSVCKNHCILSGDRVCEISKKPLKMALDSNLFIQSIWNLGCGWKLQRQRFFSYNKKLYLLRYYYYEA